ncbi:sulfite exporter TauE/SafE family protein [Leucobacter sp. G161]|uniref:sulfite exporter TauE/SafE family protein n=1 Tax=Leucobacter sp. G161 TaxID=663704 RepID=UPI00073B6123|nr:sulfite exporter TauE/SafE family protein [Leucobacter sp. G161]KUF05564.1 sulfite transporter TauE/SafE [Leucobacter sp. G161]
MTLTLGILIVLVTVVGAAAQRMAGLGFALLVSPLMTLLLGGHSGVLLVNILGVVSSLLILPRVWRSVDWSMFRWLTPFAIIGAVVGSWLSQLLSPAVMAVSVGAIVLLALSLSLIFTSERFSTEPRAPRALTGLLSGLTNSLAGVGGPAVSAYAVLTRWPQVSFAATLQPYFVVTGLASAGAKLLMNPAGMLPDTDWWFWGIVFAAILLGIAAGERLLRLVTPAQVRRFVVILACAGAAASFLRGLVTPLS